jgi:hypothetical protein
MIETASSILGSPQTDAAALAGLVSLVVAVVTARITLLVTRRNIRSQLELAEKRIATDLHLAERKIQGDIVLVEKKAQADLLLAEQKMLRDYKLEFAAERVANKLLSHPQWSWRSFQTIQHFLGGFDENELRRVLVRAGAIRALSKDGKELWGLLDRNLEVQEIAIVEREGFCPGLTSGGEYVPWMDRLNEQVSGERPP